MTVENKTNISFYFEIKVPIDTDADEKLQLRVLESLKQTYGDPLPDPVSKRIKDELDVAISCGYSLAYLTHEKIIRSAENHAYPFYLLWSNGASLINHALNITKINPLPPHYRCGECKQIEFIKDDLYEDGFLLPKKNCPVCGKRMISDGHNLNIESFIGFHYDKYPHLSLGIANTKFEDAVLHFEKFFNAKPKDINEEYSKEDGYESIYISIVPIECLYDDKKTFRFSEMNNPSVFELLSQQEAYTHFLVDKADINLVKNLLECVEIENFSDLAKICGLINSRKWLSYILPSIKKGTTDYRKVISAREDIYRYLMRHRIGAETSYKITEMTRKGKIASLLKDNNILDMLKAHKVPDEYISDLKNIGYVITQAQARELAIIAYESALQMLKD